MFLQKKKKKKKKSILPCFLRLTTHLCYARVLQFKKDRNMADKYLVGETVPWKVPES